jgi:hypothetical protein
MLDTYNDQPDNTVNGPFYGMCSFSPSGFTVYIGLGFDGSSSYLEVGDTVIIHAMGSHK